MKKNDPNINKIIDFIFKNPEEVVLLLKEEGYPIDVNTTTFQEITKYTSDALDKKNERFAYALADTIVNGGSYTNFVVLGVGAVVSLASAFIGAGASKKIAKQQMKDAMDAKMAEIASNEKLQLEILRTQEETKRMDIFARSIGDYRKVLQQESTIRLKDSWIYLAGLACGIGVLYGLYLMKSKSN